MFAPKLQNIKHLLVIEDDQGKRMIAIQAATCTIGRDPSNTIVLYSPCISRQHATLLRITIPETSSYLFRIVDGNLQGTRSLNGLIVNGKSCFSYDLQHGDKIVFGGEVKAKYYATDSASDIEFLSSCESDELSVFLLGMHNPFNTLNTSNNDLRDFNDASLVKLASFPELISYPIVEMNLLGEITYLNPSAINLFPDILDQGINHYLLKEILEILKTSTKDFFIRNINFNSRSFEQSIQYIAESDLIRNYFIDVTERKATEKALMDAYDDLEIRVNARTVELQMANQKLQAEIIERQKAEEEVRFVQTMMKSISESTDFQSALTIALQMICEVTGWSYGEAWIPNRSGTYLENGFIWHPDNPQLVQLKQKRQNCIFSPNEGISGRAWISKKPELLKHITDQANPKDIDTQLALDAGLSTSLSIPLIDKNQVVAVLIFFGYEACREDSRMIQLVSAVAIHIGSLMRRRQAEDALRASHATNRALLNAIPDWMFRINNKGIIVNFYDPKICHSPLLKKDFLGKYLSDVLPLNVAKSLIYEIQNALDSNDVQRLEYQLELNEKLFEYEARIAVSDANEVMVIIRDITERKQSEAEILNALEREKELNELKSRFVSMASHEFKTPLTTILSSTQLLESYSYKWSTSKKTSHFQRIQTAVRQMTELLNDVLLINKSELGKIEFYPMPIFVSEFCNEIVEEMQLIAENHKIIFENDSKHEIICADHKLLRHILTNLLSNAIKYSVNQDNIYLNLSSEYDQIIFKVIDSGIGIPEEDQDKIFTSFHRASNVGTISGTGLGLSIIKRSVDLHKGNIDFHSKVGIGTTFTIKLSIYGDTFQHEQENHHQETHEYQLSEK